MLTQGTIRLGVSTTNNGTNLCFLKSPIHLTIPMEYSMSALMKFFTVLVSSTKPLIKRIKGTKIIGMMLIMILSKDKIELFQ